MRFIFTFFVLVSMVFSQDIFKESALKGYFEVEGYSAPNQTRFSAIIAAKVDAQRRLLEIIKGARITSETTIENGILKNDIMVNRVNGILKGARMIEKKYDRQSGTATMKLAIGFNSFLSEAMEDDDFEEIFIEKTRVTEPIFTINSVEKHKIMTKQKSYYDGLIVDVSNTDMEPAYVNRIFSNQKIVFDPTKIPQQVFIKRGYASYTTSIQKARAILDSFGTRNPLIIKANNTTKLKSDIIINQDDASLIINSNFKNSFLESAKVVFVFGD